MKFVLMNCSGHAEILKMLIHTVKFSGETYVVRMWSDIRHFKIGVYDRPLTANGKLFQGNCSLVEDMRHGILKSNMN